MIVKSRDLSVATINFRMDLGLGSKITVNMNNKRGGYSSNVYCRSENEKEWYRLRNSPERSGTLKQTVCANALTSKISLMYHVREKPNHPYKEP